MPKNTKIPKYQKYVISNRPGRTSWVGFENNLFCNIYAKYVKYAKYVCTKYVRYVEYAKYTQYGYIRNM